MNTYLNDLVAYRKKKTRLFKWKVVEAYRAERVQASELEEKLGISGTELRRLNRWYYRCRIVPLLSPSKRRRTMKRDADYVKLLERKLADMEKENQFLRLQTEAYQTVIQIAEEQFNIPIIKKAWPHRRTGQAAEKLTRRYPLVGMELICRLFGRVRQAWYAATRRKERTSFQTDAILQEVRRIRRDVPGMGTHKLHSELRTFLLRHRIKLGRDRLHLLLKEYGMLAKKKASKMATTDSNHPHYKYPNKAKDLKPTRINELWVSDLTYISVGPNFAYLYVIMDAFSRKIVGWSLQKTMHAQGALNALKMAFSARKDISQSLIHRCSFV